MLHSIGFKYNPVEDRLVLKFVSRTQGGDEQREQLLCLTRRICARWSGDLQAMIDSASDELVRSQSIPNAGAAKPASSGSTSDNIGLPSATAVKGPPPAAAPLLVTGVRCGRRRSDGRWVIRFLTVDPAPLALVLSNSGLTSLVKALARHVKNTGWNLPPVSPEPTPRVGLNPKSLH
jgi:hypothetical protein